MSASMHVRRVARLEVGKGRSATRRSRIDQSIRRCAPAAHSSAPCGSWAARRSKIALEQDGVTFSSGGRERRAAMSGTTSTSEQEQRAKWDLLLLDLEQRAEQVRPLKAYKPRPSPS